MTEECYLPKIRTDFDSPSENNFLYKEVTQNTLKKIIPKELLVEGIENYQNKFESFLPLMRSTPCFTAPSNISFYLLAKYRPNAFKFFFEMISRWLVPGKRLNVILVYAADFAFENISEDIYTLCEVMIKIEDQAELDEIMRHLPIIETEVCLGVESRYYARRILEVKGLSADEKTALIQEYIAYIVSRLPKNFQHDIFTEMQHVMVMCRDEFKARRNVKHLSRLICAQYLFRKSILEKLRASPEKRHLPLKLFREQIFFGNSRKNVMGVLVGLNFMKDKEIFQETHLVKAIQNYLPNAIPIENSFFTIKRGSESICTLYVEIEKPDGTQFLGKEISLLRNHLPAELEGCIEHMMHPVFMPRNEEEIMRNMLSLSGQIKYLRDIPQMFVSFDEQTEFYLFFTIIMVRVVKPGMQSIEELFKKSGSSCEYIHDQCKTVGYLRKKYPKQATVFQVKVPKAQFLRLDHSIDLYKARQVVVSEISHIVGDVRDFNGGMISKQNELLSSIRKLLKNSVKYNDLLLENLFYALNPMIMRTVLEPETLKNFFLMYLDAVNGKLSEKVRIEPHFVYMMTPCENEEAIKENLSRMKINPSSLATVSLAQGDTSYFGLIYRCDDPQKQSEFCKEIQIPGST